MLDIILSVVVPAVIGAAVSLWLGRKQTRKTQVEIEKEYQGMLAHEIGERQKLAKRFDDLELRLDKVERAYYRSLAHIRRVDPHNPPPDFLEWDTAKLKQYYRDRYGE